jgi:hypothetical protein
MAELKNALAINSDTLLRSEQQPQILSPKRESWRIKRNGAVPCISGDTPLEIASWFGISRRSAHAARPADDLSIIAQSSGRKR